MRNQLKRKPKKREEEPIEWNIPILIYAVVFALILIFLLAKTGGIPASSGYYPGKPPWID